MPSRPKEKLNTNPGPGQYTTEHYKLRNSPRTIIGNSLLQSSFHVLQSPGPGDYLSEKSSVVKSSQQQISFKGRYKERTDSSPGPLTYRSEISKDLQCKPRSPVVKIATAGRKDPLNIVHVIDVPGPGKYTLEKKRSGPQMGFTIPQMKR